MGIFDLVLIFSVFVVLLLLLGMLMALVARRRAVLRRLVLGVVIYVGVYVLLLVSVSLLSPQQVLAMHQQRCFDDWCASVEQVEPPAHPAPSPHPAHRLAQSRARTVGA
jgi:cytochrome c biogenesis protein CcdA